MKSLGPLPRLSEVIRRLGGPEVRNGRIPAFWRDGTNPNSVSIDDDRGIWFDFVAGSGGGVIDLIMSALGCTKTEAGRWLAESDGVRLNRLSRLEPPRPTTPADKQARIDFALNLWAETEPLPGTPGERYYSRRNLSAEDLEHAVRWHVQCPFGRGERRGCVVALMRDPATDEPCGIHRTAMEGIGRKKMLGRAGVVKISTDDDVTMGLGIAEGIETSLTILQSGWRPIWAALSAGGIERLPMLPGVEHLTIWADHDEVGLRAARACAGRWTTVGAAVSILYPEISKSDFNDGRSA